MSLGNESKMISIVVGSVLGAALVFATSSALCSAEVQSPQEAVKQTILSLDKTRKSIFEHHFMAAAAVDAPAASRQEALLFIAYLDGRISHYCQTLYLSGGPRSLEGLPCSNAGQGAGTGDPRFEKVPDFSGQTSQEKVAALENEFTATLGEFDDMLLEEQEKVAAHIPRQREYGGDSQGEGTAGAEGAAGAAGESAATEQVPGRDSGQNDARTGEGGPERQAGSEGAGRGSAENSQPQQAGGPGAMTDDDDVVARQLREAAEQETDPEVKEKLWEEYRKYKEGTR